MNETKERHCYFRYFNWYKAPVHPWGVCSAFRFFIGNSITGITLNFYPDGYIIYA